MLLVTVSAAHSYLQALWRVYPPLWRGQSNKAWTANMTSLQMWTFDWLASSVGGCQSLDIRHCIEWAIMSHFHGLKVCTQAWVRFVSYFLEFMKATSKDLSWSSHLSKSLFQRLSVSILGDLSLLSLQELMKIPWTCTSVLFSVVCIYIISFLP